MHDDGVPETGQPVGTLVKIGKRLIEGDGLVVHEHLETDVFQVLGQDLIGGRTPAVRPPDERAVRTVQFDIVSINSVIGIGRFFAQTGDTFHPIPDRGLGLVLGTKGGTSRTGGALAGPSRADDSIGSGQFASGVFLEAVADRFPKNGLGRERCDALGPIADQDAIEAAQISSRVPGVQVVAFVGLFEVHGLTVHRHFELDLFQILPERFLPLRAPACGPDQGLLARCELDGELTGFPEVHVHLALVFGQEAVRQVFQVGDLIAAQVTFGVDGALQDQAAGQGQGIGGERNLGWDGDIRRGSGFCLDYARGAARDGGTGKGDQGQHGKEQENLRGLAAMSGHGDLVVWAFARLYSRWGMGGGRN